MSVSIIAGALDLYSPKFNLDALGMPGEKVTIRVVVASKDGLKRVILFGTYTVGGRHAQISSSQLQDMGSEVDVVSIERYSFKDFIDDTNGALIKLSLSHPIRFVWENGKVFLRLEGEVLPVVFQKMYTAAAKACAILECQGKTIKAVLREELELFDPNRRKLSGLRLKDEKLILEREFQNLGRGR